MNKKSIFLKFLIALILFSCEKFKETTSLKRPSVSIQNTVDNAMQNDIVLVEDLPEINSYCKNVYEKDGKYYIELDLIEIKYKNVDKRVIVNKNPKIRTYIIDDNTWISSKDCRELKLGELLEIKDKLVNYKDKVVIGTSKNGRMVSLNFGCYG